jgi:hypothetical protein
MYYFASREEARQWAQDKEEIAILTPDEAFELGRLAFSKLIAASRSHDGVNTDAP